eukprot:scaffold39063_cov128-Skeletonema_dohrnii-CCMP3373.AAC.2
MEEQESSQHKENEEKLYPNASNACLPTLARRMGGMQFEREARSPASISSLKNPVEKPSLKANTTNVTEY